MGSLSTTSRFSVSVHRSLPFYRVVNLGTGVALLSTWLRTCNAESPGPVGPGMGP
jgi:hypothetical protein